MGQLSTAVVEAAVRAALVEDVGAGDVTTLATVPATAKARAVVVAREPLVVAGLKVVETVFRQVSPALRLVAVARDRQCVPRGAALLRVTGPARAILVGERVALNFIQRLAGVATRTAQFVAAVKGTGAKILDTRKTTPGWRHLEKYAVACGGGHNHRLGLFDQVLIKDNHLATLRHAKPSAVAAAVARARAKYPRLKIEVEADSLEQVAQAAAAGAHIILLYNMTTQQLRAAVQLVRGRALTEASGGVTLDSVRAIAETGVDFISVGAITHSARAMDVALDFQA